MREKQGIGLIDHQRTKMWWRYQSPLRGITHSFYNALTYESYLVYVQSFKATTTLSQK